MMSPIVIAYIGACFTYVVASFVVFFTVKKAISTKFIIISAVIATLLFAAVSVYYWTVDAMTEADPTRIYLAIVMAGVLISMVMSPGLFIVKNARLSIKNTLGQVSSEQKEKIAMLVGYETMLKEKMITQEEYDQKEREIFGDDEKKESDVADV